MSLPDATLWEAFQLGPFTVPRLWTGLWQLSSTAWGSASAAKIRQGMMRHFSHGFTAFDMADHYGGSEILFGQFRESLSPPQRAIGATKWCVFKPTEPSRAVVEAAVRERLTRMRSSSVDLLQFHWQDYSDKGYMTALRQLQDLQREGLITTLGLCNFDTAHTDEICTQLGPGAIVSNQVQFSLIDTRPLHGMADVCEKHGIKLLTYGSMCGGFLADAWLQQPEPDPYSGALTPSQRKYLDVIMKAWGDWPLFQELLGVLRAVGDRHGGASIANVAARWVLDHPFVGAVLVGTRLGVSEHPDDNRNVFRFALTEQDRAEIEAVLERSNGRRMITIIGDCGAEYR
ncbi:Aldo/keto reductase [Dentipellis sp. KUC8613]|nr:Aldo/keto reductase [Dentipellis sp. KUC8613]